MNAFRRPSRLWPILLTALPLCVEAATIHVPEDYPTVLAGVDAAVSGDTVLVGPGVWADADTRVVLINGFPYQVTSLAFAKGGVTLASSAGAEVTTLDMSGLGSGATGVFFADQDEGLTIDGFSFTGVTPDMGDSRCLLGSLAPSLTVRSCRFVGIETDLDGSAIPAPGIEVAGGCVLVLEDSEFVENSSYGGLVTIRKVDAEIRGCEFRENVGIGIQALDDEQSVGNTEWLIEDCRFLDNTTARCVFLTGGPFVVRGCEFLRNANEGANSGVGIYAWTALTYGTIESCTFVQNWAFGTGAAIHARDGSLEIRSSTFYGNHSENAGGA